MMKKALQVVELQSGLLARRKIFVYVGRSRYICCIISGNVERCRWNVNLLNHFTFSGLCDHTFLNGLEINIIGSNNILRCIKGRTFDHSLFFCWIERCRKIHKPRIFLVNMKIPKFQLCVDVNALFVGFVYPSI